MTRNVFASLLFVFLAACLSPQAFAIPCTPETVQHDCADGATCSIKSCGADGQCHYDYLSRTLPDTLCDDGFACTVDSCEPGVGAPNTGCRHVAHSESCPAAPSGSCLAYTCVLGGGCIPTPDSSLCPSDGVDCTRETCADDGTCSSPAIDSFCDSYGDGIGCTDEVCNPYSTGTGCEHQANNGLCGDDGLACTIESCDPARGGCVITLDHSQCNDGLDCTIDTCDAVKGAAGTGCLFTPNNAVCTGGNLCNTDTCAPDNPLADQTSGCLSGPEPCDDLIPCTKNTCNAADGSCSYPADPTFCSSLDGHFCNGVELCQPGSGADANGCVAATETPNCSDGSKCTADSCDPVQDKCVHKDIPDICSDNNPCTTDTCAGNTCGHTFVANNTPCNTVDFSGRCVEGNCVAVCANDSECSDNNPCTGVELCLPGDAKADINGCVPGTPPSCDDESVCTDDSCDPELGCQNIAVPNSPATDCDLGGIAGHCVDGACYEICATNEECDDHNACNGQETCSPGAVGAAENGCLHGTTLTCNDGVGCTTDTCDAVLGCQFTPDNSRCDDTLACTTDTCDRLKDCVHTPVDALCQNSLYCDGHERCAPDVLGHDNRGCVAGSPVVCVNDVPCAPHVCSEAAGACVYQPDDTRCDNGLACDGGGTCQPTNPARDATGCILTPAPDCSDTVACTDDHCVEIPNGHRCDHIPNNNRCDNDTIVCNGENICNPTGSNPDAKGCTNVPPNCDDHIPCTEDYCDELGNGCAHITNSAQAIAACSDHNPCNGVEACTLSGCVPGTPVTCNDDYSCTNDICVNQGGVATCQYVPQDEGCDNSLWCNGTESCNPQGGGASPVTGCVRVPRSTCADTIECTDDSCSNALKSCVFTPNDNKCPLPGECRHRVGCNATTGCVYADEADGKPCGSNGKCQSGICRQECTEDSDCVDPFACTLDACSGGKCVHVANDELCPGGSFCGGEKTCSLTAGCVTAPGFNCDDKNPCTDDACDELNHGCTHTPNDGLCQDSSWCNGAETCDLQKGCLPGLPRCNDGIYCTTDSCDESTHQCSVSPDSTKCDDGKFCNGAEICDPSGKDPDTKGCVSGTPPSCNDSVYCTHDACDPERNACAYTPVDTECTGLNPCVHYSCSPTKDCQATPLPDVPAVACPYDAEHPEIPGVCVAGLCKPGCTTDKDCDDGFACTSDSCDQETHGCLHLATDSICSNNDVCDGIELCSPEAPLHDALGCILGEALACNDGFSCTADTCNATSGCVFTAILGACDDHNACNGLELCLPTATNHGSDGCAPGTTLDCNDQRSCTVDTCNAAKGCSNTPENSLCDDHVACSTDVCDPLLGDAISGCTHTANDLFCADGVSCTNDSCDLSKGCLNTPINALCKDALDCTSEICDAQKGCLITPHDALCDDTLFCNGRERCDTTVGCQHVDVPNCNDQVDCTVDSCDENRKLCLHEPSDSLCSGGSFCGGAVHCSLVSGCVFDPEPSCDDNVACTTDSCDAQAGKCLNTANDSACDDQNPCTGPDQCIPGGCSNPKLADDTACTVNGGKNGVCKNGICALPCTKDTDCDDGAPCTDDTCGSNNRCVYTAVDARCNVARDVCLGPATCVAHVGCVDGPLPDCSDGLACTLDSCTPNQGCVHSPDNSGCDDQNPCTTDACAVLTGCTHTALPDRTPCASDYICLNGACVPPDTDGDIDTTDGDPDSDGTESDATDADSDVTDSDPTDAESDATDQDSERVPESDQEAVEPLDGDESEAEMESEAETKEEENESVVEAEAELDTSDTAEAEFVDGDHEPDNDFIIPDIKEKSGNCQSTSSPAASAALLLLAALGAFILRRRRAH